MIKALRYSDWRVRRNAASALGKLAKEGTVAPLLKKAVEPLTRTLKDENVEVRRTAADALMWSFFGAAFDIDRRAWAFDETRTKEVVDSLIEAFVKDEDKSVRNTVIFAISAIPIPMKLEEGERIVRRVEKVEGVTASGFLLLTNKRLIYHGYSASESYSLDIPLTEIISCEVKKSLFGKKKLVVKARRAIFKSLSKLVIQKVATHGFSQPPESVITPKPIEFNRIKEVERLKSEIMEQRTSAYKSLPPKVEICPSCGTSVPAGAIFCPSCGRKVK